MHSGVDALPRHFYTAAICTVYYTAAACTVYSAMLVLCTRTGFLPLYASVRSRSDHKIHGTPVINVLGFDSLYIRTAVLEIEIDLPFLNRDFPDLPEMEIVLHFSRFSILTRDRD